MVLKTLSQGAEALDAEVAVRVGKLPVSQKLASVGSAVEPWSEVL